MSAALLVALLAKSSVVAALGLAPVLADDFGRTHPRAADHFARLRAHPAFALDLAPYLARLERNA